MGMKDAGERLSSSCTFFALYAGIMFEPEKMFLVAEGDR